SDGMSCCVHDVARVDGGTVDPVKGAPDLGIAVKQGSEGCQHTSVLRQKTRVKVEDAARRNSQCLHAQNHAEANFAKETGVHAPQFLQFGWVFQGRQRIQRDAKAPLQFSKTSIASIALAGLVDEREDQLVEQLLLDEGQLPEHSSRVWSATTDSL